MKKVINVLILFLLSVSSYTVHSATINGSFGVTGALSTDVSNDILATLADVTEITLSNVGGTGNSSGDTDDVRFLSTNLVAGSTASLTGFSAVAGFLNIEGWSLELISLNIDEQRSPNIGEISDGLLLLSGTGWLTGTDSIGTVYDSTFAIWTFSTSSLDSYSMSVETTVVPVPAAVWLFGSGLIGLVAVARRKV